ALQRSEANVNPSLREAIMADMGLNSLEVKDGKRAVEFFEKCFKEFPESGRKSEWTLALARAYAVSEKKDRSKKLLDSFILEHPAGADSEKARTLLKSLE